MTEIQHDGATAISVRLVQMSQFLHLLFPLMSSHHRSSESILVDGTRALYWIMALLHAGVQISTSRLGQRIQ